MSRSLERNDFLAIAAIAAGVWLASESPVDASTSTLTSGAATLTFDTSAAGVGGVDSLDFNGADHMGLTTYFYRAGSTGPETSIFSLPVVEVPQAGADETLLRFENSDLRFEIRLVVGSSATQVVIDEVFTVTNKTASPLSLFRYSDLDLGGDSSDATLSAEQTFPLPPLSAPVASATLNQADSVNTATGSATLNAFAGLTSPVSVTTGDAAALLSSLTDGSTTAISGSSSTSSSGDLASVLQWEVDPTAFGITSFSGSAKTNIDAPLIPEPGTFVVYAGLLVSSLVRTRHEDRCR